MNSLSDLTPSMSIWIPHWMPYTLNEIMKVPHWAVGAKRKKEDETTVAMYFRASGIPVAPDKQTRRVSLLVIFPPGKRMPDKDSLEKSCLDALVLCDALRGDSPALCARGEIHYARAASAHDEFGTLIILQDRF